MDSLKSTIIRLKTTIIRLKTIIHSHGPDAYLEACTLHRGAFCQFPFRLIFYCLSSNSTGKKLAKRTSVHWPKLSFFISPSQFKNWTQFQKLECLKIGLIKKCQILKVVLLKLYCLPKSFAEGLLMFFYLKMQSPVANDVP